MKNHDTFKIWLWHLQTRLKLAILPAGWLLLWPWFLLQRRINRTQRSAPSAPKSLNWPICWGTPLWAIQTLSPPPESRNGTLGWVQPLQTGTRALQRRGRYLLQRRDFYSISNCFKPRKQKNSGKKYCHKKRVLQHLPKDHKSDPEEDIHHKTSRNLRLLRNRRRHFRRAHRDPKEAFHRPQSSVHVRWQWDSEC